MWYVFVVDIVTKVYVLSLLVILNVKTAQRKKSLVLHLVGEEVMFVDVMPNTYKAQPFTHLPKTTSVCLEPIVGVVRQS